MVTRAYRPGAEHCARALELLLSTPKNKQAAQPRKPGVPESHLSGHAGVGGGR
jgi:hypothetical protein